MQPDTIKVVPSIKITTERIASLLKIQPAAVNYMIRKTDRACQCVKTSHRILKI